MMWPRLPPSHWTLVSGGKFAAACEATGVASVKAKTLAKHSKYFRDNFILLERLL
jgi:hypothetical protein